MKCRKVFLNSKQINGDSYLLHLHHPAGGDRESIEDVAKYVTGNLPDFKANLEHLHSEIGVAMIKRTKSFSKHATVLN
jgi:hypothetical protein